MSNILDQMLPSEQFIPTTVEEYVALQVAKRLGDQAAVRQYVHLISHHDLHYIMRTCGNALAASDPHAAFHQFINNNAKS